MEPASIGLAFEIVTAAIGIAGSLYGAYKHIRARQTLKAIEDLQKAGSVAILAIEKTPMPEDVRRQLKKAIQEGTTLLDVEGATWAPFVDDVLDFLQRYQAARQENVTRSEQIADVVHKYTGNNRDRLRNLAKKGAATK